MDFARSGWVGTESEEAGKAHQEAKPLQKMQQAMESFERADDAFWKSLDKKTANKIKKDPTTTLFTQLFLQTFTAVRSVSISSVAELEVQIDQLKKITPYWLKASMNELFTAWRVRIELNEARDKASAETLAARRQSGIHSVGLNHYVNTTRHLEKLCKQEIPANGGKVDGQVEDLP